MVSPWLTVARIIKTQGRHGEVAAEILTDFPQRLAQRDQVWLWDGTSQPRPITVENSWPHKNYLVFKLAGRDSIAQAEELVGLEIQIPCREAAPLGETEFYLDELVGCRVVEQASGRELGRVREVLPTGGTDLLAVDTPEGKELLIPFVEEFCLRVAPEEKLIQVVLPEGLRNVNE
ncbi:ribosome maturation factor RimM [Acidobacteriia bacterium AH_259_A11_L15]|nr:ribosome maturation factor RimM [Acidobacteriia bacterium AH_259_A11_L15]